MKSHNLILKKTNLFYQERKFVPIMIKF